MFFAQNEKSETKRNVPSAYSVSESVTQMSMKFIVRGLRYKLLVALNSVNVCPAELSPFV
jgi:hypothetical protein